MPMVAIPPMQTSVGAPWTGGVSSNIVQPLASARVTTRSSMQDQARQFVPPSSGMQMAQPPWSSRGPNYQSASYKSAPAVQLQQQSQQRTPLYRPLSYPALPTQGSVTQRYSQSLAPAFVPPIASIVAPSSTQIPLTRGPEDYVGPYEAMLQFLTERGVFVGLPKDAQGVLRVNIPFCSSILEMSSLVPFLTQTFLERQGCKSVAISAADVQDQADTWSVLMRGVRQSCPNMSLHIRCADLAKESMPPAALILGIHPEAANEGPWQQIITNIVRGIVPGGLCVFATFFEFESETVVQMCANVGAKAEVFANPYYDNHPCPFSPYMRFIIVLRGR